MFSRVRDRQGARSEPPRTSRTAILPPSVLISAWKEAIVSEWVEVCGADDVEMEEVTRFDHGGKTFAVYRSPDGDYFATDGLCTHEKIHLADGLVMDDIIECPKHNGRFNYKTGQARGAPVCVNLKTYPVKVDAGKVFMRLA